MTLAQWALFGAWEIWGLAVWSGVFRGWRSRGPEVTFLCLLMPWVAAALVLLVVVPELTAAFGAALLSDLGTWLVAGGATTCLGIGVSVASAERPTWALPPWYRQSTNSGTSTRVVRVPGRSLWLKTFPIQSFEREKER
jgi:hypothetical protein